MSAEPWQRNLRAIWASQFIAMIGMSGVVPFLPLYVRELGVSTADAPMWAGIIAAAPFLVASLLTPLWGALGDKYGQKPMVLRAVLGLGLTVSLMGFAQNVQMLLILRLIQGAASGFVASNNAFVSSQSPREKAGYAMATLQTSLSAGSVIGPLIGGSLGDAVGFRWAFVLVGVLCLVSFGIVWYGVHEDVTIRAVTPGRIGKNLEIVVKDKGLRSLLLMLFVGQSAVVLTAPIFPFYLEQLGAPTEILATLAGAAVSVVGVCTIFSAPWWGKRSDRMGYRATMIAVTAIITVGIASQAVVPSFGWIYPIRMIIGLAVGALLPLTYAELTRRSPDGRRGGIMGLASSATLMGNLTGPLVCSVIVGHFPVRIAFLAAATLMLTVHFLARRVPLRTALVTLFMLVVLPLSMSMSVQARPNGFPGRASMATPGCGECHGDVTPNLDVLLRITAPSGPIVIEAGKRQVFTIIVAHPEGVDAGIDVAVAAEPNGTTNIGVFDAPQGNDVRVTDHQLVHSTPHPMLDSASFTFGWTAPSQPGTYYMQAAGLAGNGDMRDGPDDRWNWMTPVEIIVTPSMSVIESKNMVGGFPLVGTDAHESYVLTVCTINGSVVHQTHVDAGQQQDALPSWLAPGVYLVDVQTRRQRYTSVILKQ